MNTSDCDTEKGDEESPHIRRPMRHAEIGDQDRNAPPKHDNGLAIIVF
jgi:hypothetical protein